MKIFRYLTYAFLFFIIATASDAQNSLPVIFLSDSTRNTSVGMFTRNGTSYGSLDDLARVFKMDTYNHSETQKLELRTDAFSITVTANNPFIVVADIRNAGNIVQLPVNVRYAAGTFFVPVESFIPILDYIMTEDIAFDRVNGKIIVGKIKPASRFDITGLDFEEKTNGFLVHIRCTKKIPDYESFLKPIGDDTWLYITLANARVDVAAINRIKASGFVKKIMVFQSPSSVQLTIRLKGTMNSPEAIPVQGTDDIVVALHPATEEQIATRKARDYERNLQRERSKWKLDVVVIDAGHGGKDPGTTGTGKTKEKDVTLGIALKLGKLLEKNLKDVKVIYTRKTDHFIELFRRGQIANQAGGKLFVSIHCNAMPRKPNPTNGFEIYLLRPGKTENAVRIAERENEVVKMEEGYEDRYQQLTGENFILLTMAQSAYGKYSEQFADILQQEMGKHLDIDNNGIKQAGFYVLVGASMPNVLVEAGYLSNKHDEKILKNGKGQQRIAEAIFSGIKRYKTHYEKSLEEGKEIGAITK
jgi:N-acetylmuramoyl-L-alanine amidase